MVSRNSAELSPPGKLTHNPVLTLTVNGKKEPIKSLPCFRPLLVAS